MADSYPTVKLWQALLLSAFITVLSVIATLGCVGSAVNGTGTVAAAYEARFDLIDQRLERIEAKLDSLIARSRS